MKNPYLHDCSLKKFHFQAKSEKKEEIVKNFSNIQTPSKYSMIILLIFRELTLTWNIEMKQSYLP